LFVSKYSVIKWTHFIMGEAKFIQCKTKTTIVIASRPKIRHTNAMNQVWPPAFFHFSSAYTCFQVFTQANIVFYAVNRHKTCVIFINKIIREYAALFLVDDISHPIWWMLMILFYITHSSYFNGLHNHLSVSINNRSKKFPCSSSSVHSNHAKNLTKENFETNFKTTRKSSQIPGKISTLSKLRLQTSGHQGHWVQLWMLPQLLHLKHKIFLHERIAKSIKTNSLNLAGNNFFANFVATWCQRFLEVPGLEPTTLGSPAKHHNHLAIVTRIH